MTTQEKVSAIIIDSLDCGEATPTSKLVDDLGADSLDLQQLFTNLEYEFGIEVSPNDAVRLVTVGEVAKFVQTELGEADGLKQSA